MKQEFQKMWGAHAMGVLAGETVAFNFSNLNNLKKKAGINEKNIIFFYKKGIGTQFFNDRRELKKLAEFGFKRFTNRKGINDYLRNSKNILKKADKLYKKFISSDWKSESIKQLFKRFNIQLRAFNEVYSFYHACQPQYFSKIEEYVRKKLEEKNSPENANEIYSTLTLSEELDPLAVEEIEWLKIVEELKKRYKKDILEKDLDENQKKKIIKHSEKYIYLGTVETNNPWNFDHYLKLLNEQLKTDISSKIKNIQDRKVELKKKKSQLIKQYKIDEKIVLICNNLAKLGVNRLALRFGWTKISYAYAEVLKEIANISSLFNLDTILEYRLSELKNCIFNKNYLYKKEVENRKKSVFFIVENGKINFFSGEEAIKRKRNLIPEETFNISEFKGTIACKGKIIGRVFLFTWVEENLSNRMDKMKKGDILVAGQTRPFLMPAIKKAGAIVTDEGGITSHAAIISRELGKPCIIGTKIATKVLKNGDLVEVDANKGIVKILE